MTEPTQPAWSAPGSELLPDARSLSAEERLVLVDTIAGLEAQLAQTSATSILTPSEQLAVEQVLIRYERSWAWRYGHRATKPLRELFGARKK